MATPNQLTILAFQNATCSFCHNVGLITIDRSEEQNFPEGKMVRYIGTCKNRTCPPALFGLAERFPKTVPEEANKRLLC